MRVGRSRMPVEPFYWRLKIQLNRCPKSLPLLQTLCRRRPSLCLRRPTNNQHPNLHRQCCRHRRFVSRIIDRLALRRIESGGRAKSAESKPIALTGALIGLRRLGFFPGRCLPHVIAPALILSQTANQTGKRLMLGACFAFAQKYPSSIEVTLPPEEALALCKTKVRSSSSRHRNQWSPFSL